MWQIFAAEFRYVYKNIILVVVIIVPGALFYFNISETAGVDNMIFPLTIATIFQLVIFRILEKRNRHSILLPLSIRQIAIARILLYLTSCLGFYGLYFILHFIFKNLSPRWQHDIYDVMMFFGLTLFGCSVYYVLHDLLFSFSRKFKTAEFDLIVFIILITAILLGIPLALAPMWGSTGDALRVLCFLSGFVFLYPAVVTFERRKSYLE
ncbi:MAG: hypothetical protein ACE5JB_08640 [bacterium]